MKTIVTGGAVIINEGFDDTQSLIIDITRHNRSSQIN